MSSDSWKIIGLLENLKKAEEALAACAYWAANGLHDSGQGFQFGLAQIMLENILKESKEYAISESGCDSNIVHEGFEYTYVPVGGWPEPEKEKM